MPVPVERIESMKADLELTLSVADYHRTRPLLKGDVKLEGINPSFYTAARGEACLRPVYEEFDVAEMSLSWYAMARSRNEPVYALPIFPMRMFIQPYIYCGANSGRIEPTSRRHARACPANLLIGMAGTSLDEPGHDDR